MSRSLLSATLVLTLGGWVGCRDVLVCENTGECSANAGAHSAAGAPDTVGGNGGEPPSVMPAAGSEATPGGSAGHAGEAGAAGQPTIENDCPPTTADCDGSTFTTCETPINYSFLHCGGCNQRCDGDCVLGTCKPGEELTLRSIHRVVSTGLDAYALVYGEAADDLDDLLRIDLQTGESQLIAKGLPTSDELFLGSERLYVRDGNQVQSVAMAGTDLRTEDFVVESFGVTRSGVYYTSYATNPDTEAETWTLWFRAPVAGFSRKIQDADSIEILASSLSGLLLKQKVGTSSELVFVQGEEVSPLGPAPDAIESARVVNDAVFVLTTSSDVPPERELLWLRSGDVARTFPVETLDDQAALVAAPGGVGLQLTDGVFPYVRLFTKDGDSAAKLGLPTYTQLVHVDEFYLWYSWYGSPDGRPRFFRARQFETSDLR